MPFGSLLLIALLGAGIAEGTPIPEGTSQWTVPLESVELELFSYKPASYRDGPLIMVFHGVLRNADEYRDHSQAMADRFGALIVAPRFSKEQFPSEKYQQGGLRREGLIQPPEQWTWRFVPQIAAEVRKRETRPEMPYYLIGHSGGGQFLLRMAGFTACDATRIVVANAGTVLFPNREHAFPYGYGELPDMLTDEQSLRRYLAQPLTFYLGSNDIERDEYLDKSPEADRQGQTRWERGQNVYQAGQRLARERGWEFGWRIVVAEGVEHDHEKMFNHAASRAALFGD